MPDYAWGIRLNDDSEDPTAHVVDFDAGETALCGVRAVLRLSSDESLPVCEECKRQALSKGIITESNDEDADQSEQKRDQNEDVLK